MSIRGRSSDTFLALLEGPLRSAQPIFWQAPDGWHCYDDAPSPTESVDDARSLGGYTTYQIPEWSQHPPTRGLGSLRVLALSAALVKIQREE
jgi:hypothetical protein